MKLSVILPAYNSELVLEKAIDSVLSQTFKDFEFIIINDGSTDKTLNIIKSYSDNRIILIDQENKGLAKTLNIGLNIAKGEYIARMDADDICIPNRFEKQIFYLDSKKDVGLLGTGVEVIDDKDKHISFHAPYVGHRKLQKIMFEKGNPFKHPSVMFRKEIALQCGGYNELIGKYFEDYFLWNSMSYISKVDNLPEILLKYRIASGSIMDNSQSYELRDFALQCVRKNEFTLNDKLHLDQLIARLNNENKFEKRINRFVFINKVVSILYKLFGNIVIRKMSLVKSYNS